MQSKMKVFYLLLYGFCCFFPYYSVFRDEKIISICTITFFSIYCLSFVFENVNFYRIFIILASIGVSIIIYLTGQINLLIPLSILPYLILNIDEEILPYFFNSLLFINLITTLFCFFNINQSEPISLANNYSYIFTLTTTVFFYIFYNNHQININKTMFLYNENKKYQQKIKELEYKIKENSAGLCEENYLALILGLNFEGFEFETNILKILETIKLSTNAVFGAFYSVNKKDNSFILNKSFGESSQLIKKPISIDIGMFASLYETKQYVYISNLLEKETDTYKRELLNNVNSLLLLPVVVNNEVIAAITIGFPIVTKKKETDLINLSCIISEKTSKEFEKIQKHKTTEKKSITDNLTGLFNRLYFDEKIVEQINNCKKENQSIAYVLIDLDYFKQMNDTHGHDFGDKVLKTAASVFKENIRSSDYAFRTGGDEFSLILVGADNEAAYNVTNNIAKAYAKKVEELHLYALKNGEEIKSSFSIGVSVYNNNTSINSAEELIKLADDAVYYVKKKGKNNIAITK